MEYTPHGSDDGEGFYWTGFWHSERELDLRIPPCIYKMPRYPGRDAWWYVGRDDRYGSDWQPPRKWTKRSMDTFWQRHHMRGYSDIRKDYEDPTKLGSLTFEGSLDHLREDFLNAWK